MNENAEGKYYRKLCLFNFCNILKRNDFFFLFSKNSFSLGQHLKCFALGVKISRLGTEHNKESHISHGCDKNNSLIWKTNKNHTKSNIKNNYLIYQFILIIFKKFKLKSNVKYIVHRLSE